MNSKNSFWKHNFGALFFYPAMIFFAGYGIFYCDKNHKDNAHQKAAQSEELDYSTFDTISDRSPASDEINWAQPPVGCPEEMIPSMPEKKCPDLSRVENPQKDWPTSLDPNEKLYWLGKRRHIDYCRAIEQLRREKESPGSQPAGMVQVSWMRANATSNYDRKVNAIYRASQTHKMPAQVLNGAIHQESLFMELGIANDGGNFSCGVGQVNLSEWCKWANKQSEEKKDLMNWPQEEVNCFNENLVKLSFMDPFYKIAVTKLRGQPEYKLMKSHFDGIQFEDVADKLPPASESVQRYRFQLVRSFIDHCSDVDNSIAAKANELNSLFKNFVPEALKNSERYPSGQRFKRNCKAAPNHNFYPLHSGWLMAVASYNAGPRAFEALAHYNQWSRDDVESPETWVGFNGKKIVESLYWGGKYNPETDNIDFNGLNGSRKNWTWFKGCVAQRHIARVAQHVTLFPDFFVDTLEGSIPCKRSVWENGKLVKSEVPPARKISSGVKDGLVDPNDWPTAKPKPPVKPKKPAKPAKPWNPWDSNFWD